MRKFAALLLVAAVFSLLSCQEPAKAKEERQQMASQIKSLEDKVTQLEGKLDQLTTDFTKHIDEFHKKASAKTTASGAKRPSVTSSGKPPKVGR